MKTKIFVFTLLCHLIISSSSCTHKNQKLNCCQGKVIELNFQNISNISDGDHIIVDDLILKHTVHEDDYKNSKIEKNTEEDVTQNYYCYIPASEMHLFEKSSGRRLIENNTSFLIASKFGQAILQLENEKGKQRYSLLNGQGFRLNGIVKFGSNDGENIQICTTKDYPVQIKIIE